MKRPGKFFTAVSLAVAVLVLAIGAYVFLKIKKPVVVGKRQIIREFSFSSPRSLDEWDEKMLSRKPTDYSAARIDGRDCVRAASSSSASALFYRQRLSCEKNPFISWAWKAEKFPARKQKESLKKRSEFDFAAQVYVLFCSRFFLNAKAIQYVWAESIPPGTVAKSPYTKNVRVMVLRTGESDEWKREERNIKKDFRDLFGKEPEKDVMAISFMTDSDSTSSEAAACYSDIVIGYLGAVPGDTEERGAAAENISSANERSSHH